ncbi:5794_t:CDS:1, partial [Diversispora eburnea]
MADGMNTRDGMGPSHGPAFKIYRRAKFLMDPILHLQSNEVQSEFFKKQVKGSNLDDSEKNYLYNLIDKELDNKNVLEN